MSAKSVERLRNEAAPAFALRQMNWRVAFTSHRVMGLAREDSAASTWERQHLAGEFRNAIPQVTCRPEASAPGMARHVQLPPRFEARLYAILPSEKVLASG